MTMTLFDIPRVTYPSAVADVRWVAEQLRRFTYRDNWILSTSSTVGNGPFARMLGVEDRRPVVEIRFQAEDTRSLDGRGRRPTIMIGGSFPVPLHIVEERNAVEFARWVQGRILEVEIHESKEWLRYDGRLYDDPHAPTGR